MNVTMYLRSVIICTMFLLCFVFHVMAQQTPDKPDKVVLGLTNILR